MIYAFDNYLIDTSARDLKSDGASVSVEPMVLDVLVHLIENNTRVVSKDELVKVVWQGRFVSDAAVSSAIKAARRAIGDSGSEQRMVKTMHGRGFRFVAPVVESRAGQTQKAAAETDTPDQEIRYCRSADGTRIAYAVAGSGPPLVKTSHWLTHLEFDWYSPVWIHINSALMEGRTLIRYDPRGNGLSEWNVSDFSLERQVEDLEAVIDAIGVKDFPLIGLSQAAAVSAAYAARHPEKVSRLACLGGYEKGWQHAHGEAGQSQINAMIQMLELGWGSETLAIQSMFSSIFMPDAAPEYQKWFSELQRKSATGKTAAALMKAIGEVDVSEILPNVKTETLVLHARNDSAISFRQGQALAAGIANARFVPLDTSNHILPESDPAWHRASGLFKEFLDA